METALIVKAVLALVFVLGLAGASLLLIKRYLIDRDVMKGGQMKRLAIVEQLYLDSKRRLVLVKKDEQELLILLGADSQTVIAGNNQLPIDSSDVAPVKTARLRSVLGRKKSSH